MKKKFSLFLFGQTFDLKFVGRENRPIVQDNRVGYLLLCEIPWVFYINTSREILK